jgi:DNA-binding MarR family transcriptional regulator
VRIDRRESLYNELLREITRTRSEFEQEAIAASVNLALTYDVQQSYLFRRLGERGLARSSFNVLLLLRHAGPEGLQLSEIGALLITSRANITGLVDHLEQKGYVKRVVSTHDRRARLARLTKRGEALIDELIPGQQTRISGFFSTLSLNEVKQLTQLLKKLRRQPAEEEESGGLHSTRAVEPGNAESSAYGRTSGALCALVNQD